MKKCPYCAEEIQDQAVVCKHCGRDLPNVEKPKPAVKTKKKLKFWQVILAILLLFGACGVFSAIINDGNETPVSAGATESAKATSTPEQTKTPEFTSTPEIDRNVRTIMEGTGLDQAKAEAAYEVIKSVGFERVQSLEFFEDVDNMKGYLADLGYTKNFLVTFVDGDVFGISTDTLVLYDKDAGGVLDQITNYVLDQSEKSLYIVTTEDMVRNILKAPSTAEFPSGLFSQEEWTVTRQKDFVWVQSWVDAQNSFGAMIRNQFTAQYRYSTGELLYLEFDGEVVFGSVQEQ